MDELNVGDSIELICRFTVAEVNTDPTTITLAVQDPSGNTASYTYAAAEITKTATGIYKKTIAFDEAGYWVYQWTGTGTCPVVDGNRILVKAALL